MIDPPASTQAAGQPAEDPVSSTTAADLAAELARVRERLKFYESFDSIIQDNVARSGAMLREVAAEREQTDQMLLEMRAEVDQQLVEQRSALEEIAAGLSGLQAHLGAVADRVSESLHALQDSGSRSLADASAVVTCLPDRESELAVATGDDAGQESTPVAAIGSATEGASGDLGMPELHVDATPVPALAASTAAPTPAVVGGSAAGAPRREEMETSSGTATGSDAPGSTRRRFDLIVHGVPRAATALSLQRYLQELAGVEMVEVREYVSGVLRFQVVATALRPDDFRDWQSGDGLEVVTDRDSVLELKLPSADSF